MQRHRPEDSGPEAEGPPGGSASIGSPATPPSPPGRPAPRRSALANLAAIRRTPLAAALAAIVLATGCGAESLGPSTATLPEGTEVPPKRYLADAVEASDAVADFGTVLAEGGTVARREALLALAPRLELALGRLMVAHQRLGAARLADRRLEDQRQRAVELLQPVVDAMRRVTQAAEDGQAARASTASDALAAAVAALRAGVATAP